MATEGNEDLLVPGQAFGAYRVVRRLGKGGMGFVYLVEHPEAGAFAVKIIDPVAVEQDSEYVSRFAHEGDFAMNIRHPNLIAVHEMGLDPETGYYFLVMDYVPGGDVGGRLAKEGPFAIDEAVRIVAQVANALVEVHAQGVIHRDIKPGNIMFAADGTPKLADLGIAKFSDAGSSIVTSADVMIGTPAYMAPEQIMDSHGVDARADIFSLGVVFFEMLTGHRPNEGLKVLEIVAQAVEGRQIPDVRTFRPEVPATIAQLLNMMCAPKREQRLASAQQVVDVFNRILRRERGEATCVESPAGISSTTTPRPKTSRREPPSSRSGSLRRETPRRSRMVLVGGVLGAVAVLSVVGLVLSGVIGPRRTSRAEKPPVESDVTQVGRQDSDAGDPLRELVSLPQQPQPEPSRPDAAKASQPESITPPKVMVKDPEPVAEKPRQADPEPPSTPKNGEVRIFTLGGAAKVEMVYCAPCSFYMGSPATESDRGMDERMHVVSLSRGFWIGKYELTRGQWRRVMGLNAPGAGSDEHPVTSVSWEDCMRFMSRAGDGFRLPTEAEWECACRAGSTGAFSGKDLSELGWYLGNVSAGEGDCHPVGRKAANAWGIHDMHGNVWEWCADWYGDYPSASEQDPSGPASGERRVVRGGWARSLESKCRSAYRRSAPPEERTRTCGFRVCRTAD